MIKHGPIHEYFGKKGSKAANHSHLAPIAKFITKGIADAKESIILEPRACDVRGAKQFNGQQCVIARALTRTHKPQAVAVGRSTAYAVFNGLAVRFTMPAASTKIVEEFDKTGRVRRVPIELRAIANHVKLKTDKSHPRKNPRTTAKRKRTKRVGVRAVGGGISLAA